MKNYFKETPNVENNKRSREREQKNGLADGHENEAHWEKNLDGRPKQLAILILAAADRSKRNKDVFSRSSRTQ